MIDCISLFQLSVGSNEQWSFRHYSTYIGLVTLDEMKAKQENIVQEHEKRIATESKELYE